MWHKVGFISDNIGEIFILDPFKKCRAICHRVSGLKNITEMIECNFRIVLKKLN